MNRISGYLIESTPANGFLARLCRVMCMADIEDTPLLNLDEDAALRMILEGTATQTGEQFFYALVENLVKALGTHGAMVTQCLPDRKQLQALAFRMDGDWVPDYVFDVPGTPCEQVIDQCRLIHFPDRLLDLFPHSADLQQLGLVSYLGMPLLDVDGKILGHLAVVDRRPMPEEPRVLALFQIFAARAAAELQRLRCESEIREREEKLGRLVDSAMDAIIELDQTLKVTRMNSAAEKIFGCTSGDSVGRDFSPLIAEQSRATLIDLIRELDARPEGQQYLWIPGGLTATPRGGDRFPAEATLSRFELQRRSFYTLILRNVNDRLLAEKKIQSLTVQTEYLKEELRELHNFDEIVGKSQPLLEVLRDVEQVAATDATVLILGETGTGKELIARAIHSASPRHAQAFIKVNCAAIPANLIESEFFGHEKGAFTGATQKRDGRFTLADGGTIFLDEVGELPTDLQMKLLRVLQEGEFEPVGSSYTRKVDARVIAATNRDLEASIKNGEFREDLFYRLNVFPIRVPPLRDRGDDVGLLASAFAQRFAKKMGRTIQPLTEANIRRLKSYNWPGNVREVENVMERAVITSQNGQVNLARALPDTLAIADACGPCEAIPKGEPKQRVYTAEELQDMERSNIIRALASSNWRVAGDNGAAKLLGLNPSTLNSRMRALRIKRPTAHS
jgi:PAS domain S-box-containing protein